MKTLIDLFIPIIAIAVAGYYIWFLLFSKPDDNDIGIDNPIKDNKSTYDGTNKMINDFELPLDKYEEELYDYNVNTIPLTTDVENNNDINPVISDENIINEDREEDR